VKLPRGLEVRNGDLRLRWGMPSLQKRVVIVTGASSGIGLW
jgi:hypothetical protein